MRVKHEKYKLILNLEVGAGGLFLITGLLGRRASAATETADEGGGNGEHK